MRTDKLVGIGNSLAQSLGQISDAGNRAYGDWTAVFVAHAKEAAGQGDLSDDVAPDDASEAILVAVLGCYLLSDALGDDLFARLARTWRVLVSPIVSAESAPFFQEFLARTAVRYG